MDTIDLYGGSVELYFKTANGNSISLSNIFFGESLTRTDFGSTVFNPQVAHFISSMSVSISILRFTEIEVTFNPPFEQAIALLNSGVLGLGFATKQPSGDAKQGDPELATDSLSTIGFNQVICKMHYGGMHSNYFKGFLLAPEIDIGTEGISIRIRATGMLFPQAKKHQNKVIKDLPRLDIIKALMGNGETFTIITNPDDDAANNFLDETHSLTANDSNWNLVKSLLDQSNCAIYDNGSEDVDGLPVYEIISKEFLRTRDDNIYNFVLWQNINPNERTFPILGLKTSIANYMMGQSLGLNTTTLSNKTKKKEDPKKVDFSQVYSTSDESQSGSPEKKDQPDPTTQISEVNKKVPVPGDKDGKEPSLKDKALGLIQKAADKALQYEITTIGLVEMRPGRSVGVSVAGVRFLSGAYDLYTVKHEFSTEGIVTHLTLARTAGLASVIDKGAGIAQKKTVAGGTNVRNVIAGVKGLVP